MAEQYTNIRTVLDRILRHPLLQDVTIETAVDYAGDFLTIVGVPSMFEDKVITLEYNNYRVKLPCDYYKVKQIKDKIDDVKYLPSEDSFFMGENKTNSPLSYRIQNSIIYFSKESGTVEFSYMAIATDSDGYPLIPDNSSFLRALELYIKKQVFTILFDMGKIHPSVLQNVQQEYAWAVGDCETEFQRMSIDKAEVFYNSWKSLILDGDQHSEGFEYLGSDETFNLN